MSPERFLFDPAGHIPEEKEDGSNLEQVKRAIVFWGHEAGEFVPVQEGKSQKG